MIPDNTMMIIIPLSTLVASLADPTPIPPHRLMLRTPAEPDLIHRMLLTKELPTLPTIDTTIDDAQRALTSRVETEIIAVGLLPVSAGDVEVRVALLLLLLVWLLVALLRVTGEVVRLEDVEALQLLVQHCDRLERFGFQHALAEPRGDVVFFQRFDFGVRIVEVAVQLQERDLSPPLAWPTHGDAQCTTGIYHLLRANRTDERRPSRDFGRGGERHLRGGGREAAAVGGISVGSLQ